MRVRRSAHRPHGILRRVFSGRLSDSQLSALGVKQRQTVIFEAELLTVLVAMLVWSDRIASRPVVFTSTTTGHATWPFLEAHDQRSACSSSLDCWPWRISYRSSRGSPECLRHPTLPTTPPGFRPRCCNPLEQWKCRQVIRWTLPWPFVSEAVKMG